jgi:hypothetical protein
MKFTPATTITPHADVVWRLVEGEVVLLNVMSGQYYSLDAVGSRVWELIPQEGAVLGTVCATLAREFDAPVEQIQHDVETLMGHLLAVDLITAA